MSTRKCSRWVRAIGSVSGLREKTVYSGFSKISVFAIEDEDVSIAPFRVDHFRVKNFGFKAVI